MAASQSRDMEQDQAGSVGGGRATGDTSESTRNAAPAPAETDIEPVGEARSDPLADPLVEARAESAGQVTPIAAVTTPAPPLSASPVAAPTTFASTRRRFIRYLLGFSVVSTLALVAAPVVSFLAPPKESSTGGSGKVPAGTTADIPLGKGKVVAMGSKPVIVVNTEQGVRAFSAICTHLGCIVAYDDANSVIACPCHAGKFNPQTGAVVAGPPPAPLPPVTVSVEGDTIYLVASA